MLSKVQDIAYVYNHFIHRAHQKRPVDVRDENFLQVSNKLFTPKNQRTKGQAIEGMFYEPELFLVRNLTREELK